MTQNKCQTEALPDVAALYLDEALEILRGVGFSADNIVKTLQPRERESDIETSPDMSYRVVRCERLDEMRVVLTVTAAREIRNKSNKSV